TRFSRDWSSDVCSSDLLSADANPQQVPVFTDATGLSAGTFRPPGADTGGLALYSRQVKGLPAAGARVSSPRRGRRALLRPPGAVARGGLGTRTGVGSRTTPCAEPVRSWRVPPQVNDSAIRAATGAGVASGDRDEHVVPRHPDRRRTPDLFRSRPTLRVFRPTLGEFLLDAGTVAPTAAACPSTPTTSSGSVAARGPRPRRERPGTAAGHGAGQAERAAR